MGHLPQTRGHDILYSDWGEKILHRSVHRIDSFVYCAQQRTCYYRTVNWKIFVLKIFRKKKLCVKYYIVTGGLNF